MIRTRFKCRKKSLAIFANQLAGGVSLKILKYFEKMLTLFKFSYLDNLPITFRRCDLTLSFCPIIILQWNTAWKVSKYGVFSGLNTGKYGPEKAPYLDAFHPVKSGCRLLTGIILMNRQTIIWIKFTKFSI